MRTFPNKLSDKLQNRMTSKALRTLGGVTSGVDFSSNDYLGFASSENIFNRTSVLLRERGIRENGATGSRLLSGNSDLHTETEAYIAKFHNTPAALLFNSGYNANIGFFSSVPQRGDIVLYDALCHASIRDGIGMGNAKAFKFQHNDLESLTKLVEKYCQENCDVYVVTEAVFSMDGDQAPLREIVTICKKYECHFVVDEAHALGIFGEYGRGLVQELGIEDDVFARVVTFGKALGCHGAAILGSETLISYLINFSRSFIYTTGPSPHSVATILAAYQELPTNPKHKQKLHINIAILQLDIKLKGLSSYFIPSTSAIHCCVIPGNKEVKDISEKLMELGLDVRPIMAPTVPSGSERLRICLHSYNTEVQIKELVSHLVSFLL